jgi:hypothetical protein
MDSTRSRGRHGLGQPPSPAPWVALRLLAPRPALSRADALRHNAGDVKLPVGEAGRMTRDCNTRTLQARTASGQITGAWRQIATVWQRRDSFVVLLETRANRAVQRFPGPVDELGREVSPRGMQ